MNLGLRHLALVFVTAAAAHAEIAVSNLSQNLASLVVQSGHEPAVSFTTGPAPTILERVDLYLNVGYSGGVQDFTLSLYSEFPFTSPLSLMEVLAGPSAPAAGASSFVGTSELAANKTYWLQAKSSVSAANTYWLALGSPDEDPGGLSGWSIGNRTYVGAITSWEFGSRIAVYVTLPDTDNDGVIDTNDHCPASDLRAKVDTGAGPTSIDNTIDSHGCTRQDSVNAAIAAAENHGQYVTSITELVALWSISKPNQNEAVHGAARSTIGK
jgi:hypothetical protein